MKKLLFFFTLIAITGCVNAQDKAVLDLPIPHYKILKADSTYTSWTALKKNKPVMIIYFMPDCPHCQHLMTELRKDMAPFRDFQIVMVTGARTEYPFMKMIRTFSHDYELPKYKNITMGTEYPNYTVLKYYNVQTTPFIAIYDRKGKMVQYFYNPPKIEDLVAAVKKV